MVGPFHEGFDEGISNLAEHRADDLFEQLAGKLVGQAELDLAGVLGQRFETPPAFQPTERPVHQLHGHPQGDFLGILGGEMRLDAVEVDVQGRHRLALVAEIDSRLAAPGEKTGVALDIVDKVEHLLRGALDQYRFFNQRHRRGCPCNPVEWPEF